MLSYPLKVKESENQTQRFIKDYGIVKLLRQCGFHKENGFGTLVVITFLIALVFSGRNLYRNLEKGLCEFQKDVIYRFLNSVRTNWSKFLLILSYRAYNFIRPLTSKNRTDCFILDDTLYDKSRSKKLELLAKVFDHVTHKFCKGFRDLTLGWTDGNTFLPIGFSLLSSQKDENIYQGVNDKIDKRTNGYKARKLSRSNTLDVALQLLKNALNIGFKAKYVLFDSWFSYSRFIKKIVDLKLNVICALKDFEHQYYVYNGKKYRLSSLYNSLKREEFYGDKNIYFAIITADMIVTETGELLPIKIAFIKTRGKKREWLAIGSTDINLSGEEITTIYGKRWSIEVFFKVAKSDLKLAKEFQGRSFDMLNAHTTIVYVRYIMLALECRKSEDGRTMGELFYFMIDELNDIKYDESLKLIIESVFEAMGQTFNPSDEAMRDFATAFIGNLPPHLKEKFLITDCES